MAKDNESANGENIKKVTELSVNENKLIGILLCTSSNPATFTCPIFQQ